eukprot:COSAG02_NODE_15802_length_1139_cov_4.092892_1_plen_59_part_10
MLQIGVLTASARAAAHFARACAPGRPGSSMAMLTLQLTSALIVCALVAELGCAADPAAE